MLGFGSQNRIKQVASATVRVISATMAAGLALSRHVPRPFRAPAVSRCGRRLLAPLSLPAGVPLRTCRANQRAVARASIATTTAVAAARACAPRLAVSPLWRPAAGAGRGARWLWLAPPAPDPHRERVVRGHPLRRAVWHVRGVLRERTKRGGAVRHELALALWCAQMRPCRIGCNSCCSCMDRARRRARWSVGAPSAEATRQSPTTRAKRAHGPGKAEAGGFPMLRVVTTFNTDSIANATTGTMSCVGRTMTTRCTHGHASPISHASFARRRLDASPANTLHPHSAMHHLLP